MHSPDVEMARRPAKPPAARQRGRHAWSPALVAGLLLAAALMAWAVFGRGSTGPAPGAQHTSRGKAAQQQQAQRTGGGSSGSAGSGSGARRQQQQQQQQGVPELLTYRVVKEFKHDPGAFTQGLQFDRACAPDGTQCRDIFWESTGMNGASTIREVELESGKVLRRAKLPQRDFGEGMTRLGDRLYMVTWRTPRTWSFSVSNFSDARLLKTPLSDGWGATSDGQHLIVGDSSEKLFFLDPASMQTARSVRVTDGGEAVRWVNELEWVDGSILANVWMTECIVRIDPASGAVTAWADLKGITQRMLASMAGSGQRRHTDVLNGIAWDAQGRRLFVTGKYWPTLYQVELVPLETSNPEAELRRLRQQCIVRDTSLLG